MEDDFDAIEAIYQWRANGPSNILTDDTLICECMCVSALDIRELFKDSKNINLEVLQEQFHLGKGCSSCLKNFKQWQSRIY